MALTFVKMHGVGNDFVVVRAEDIVGLDPSRLAQRLCARHFGVGSDGLLIIGRPSIRAVAFSFRMHNPDGTPDMCGNGLRCAVLYAHRIGLVPESDEAFLVETVEGSLHCRLIGVSSDRLTAEVRVEMATPRLAAKEVPFVVDSVREADLPVINSPISVAKRELLITALNTGSTHAVVFTRHLIDETTFLEVSPALELHERFPERTSVMWTTLTGPAQFEIRIWERGAGETYGCGTGACAVAGAAILNGFADHGNLVKVASKGGVLVVDWPRRDGPMWLSGPAKWVFEGTLCGEQA